MKRIKPKPRPVVVDAEQERERAALAAAGNMIVRCRVLDDEGNTVGWRESHTLNYLIESAFLRYFDGEGRMELTEKGWNATMHAATAAIRQGVRR